MEGSADDQAAPDSWETADLEASMTRLLLPSRKAAATSASGGPTLPELESNAAAAAVAVSTTELGGAVSEDVIGQVDQFLREALEKPRERLSVLRMEQDIEKFIQDPTQQHLELPALPTSYLRLAAHRLAQHYYLQSLVVPDTTLPDGSGSRIVLRKTFNECPLPAIRLADIPVKLPQEDSSAAVKVAIKQRPHKHSQNITNANTHSSKTNHQKSVEERKEEYNRARARIFSNNHSSSSSTVARTDDEIKLPHSLHDCSFLESNSDDKSLVEAPEDILGRSLNESSTGNRSNRNMTEREPQISRYQTSSRVAIFRDREMDRKDPDYDRSYDRYMQRFDPGFGFSGGSFTMQPLYSPAVNYNTEFPQLGSGHRSPVPIEQQPRSISQHLHGHWSAAAGPSTIGYHTPEGMMAPFNPTHIGAPVTPPVYVHSTQYSVPSRPGMSFVQPRERMQPFVQAHQQQPEASFGLARPR